MRAALAALVVLAVLASAAAADDELDITAETPTPENGSTVNASNVTLNFSLSAAANCTLAWNGTNESAEVADLSALVVKSGLIQSPYWFQLFCASANASNQSELRTFFASPPLELRNYTVRPANGSAGANATFSPNNDSANDTVTVSANSSRRANFSLEVRDRANATVKSFTASKAFGLIRTWNGTGTAGYNNGSVVPDGPYLLRLRLVDAMSGEELIDASAFAIVDDLLPNITALQPENGTNTSNTTVSFFANLSEPGSCALELNGSNETMNGTDAGFVSNRTNLTSGNYTYAVHCSDAAGNAVSAGGVLFVNGNGSNSTLNETNQTTDNETNGTGNQSNPQNPPPPAPPQSSGGSGGSSSSTDSGSGGFAPKPLPQFCNERWSCGNWSACANGTQRRACAELNKCGTNQSRPRETVPCAAPAPSAPATEPSPTSSTPRACEPGSFACISGLRSQCSADGARWLLVEACEFGCGPLAASGGSAVGCLAQAAPVSGQFVLEPANIAIGLGAAAAAVAAFALRSRFRRRRVNI